MAEDKRTRRKTKVATPAKREPKAPAVALPVDPVASAREGNKVELLRQRGARRCGFIALIGAPNVGKSTLINALVGSKVAIVSHKMQTTRSPLRGIATADGAQLVFIDTPGIFAPRRRLDRAMVTNAWAGAADADLVGMMIEATRGVDAEASDVLDQLADIPRPRILLINKVDLVDKTGVAGNCPLRQQMHDVCRDLHDFRAHRGRRGGRQELACAACPRGAVALSRGSDHRRTAAPACRRDYP